MCFRLSRLIACLASEHCPCDQCQKVSLQASLGRKSLRRALYIPARTCARIIPRHCLARLQDSRARTSGCIGLLFSHDAYLDPTPRLPLYVARNADSDFSPLHWESLQESRQRRQRSANAGSDEFADIYGLPSSRGQDAPSPSQTITCRNFCSPGDRRVCLMKHIIPPEVKRLAE